MASIKIDFSGVREANNRLNRILKELENAEDELSSLSGAISFDIRSRRQIDSQLILCRKQVGSIHSDGKKLHSAVSRAVQQYSDTEMRLRRAVSDDDNIAR